MYERLGSVLLEGKLAQVVKRTRESTKKLLYRHTDEIDFKIVDGIADKEGLLAMNRYIERRKAGLANDSHSKEPGIRIFLTEEGQKEIAKQARFRKFNADLKKFPEMVPGIVFTELPKGIYAESLPEIFFAAESGKDDKLFEKAKKRFFLNSEHVVRVEGYKGELWQNKAFNWGGSKKV